MRNKRHGLCLHPTVAVCVGFAATVLFYASVAGQEKWQTGVEFRQRLESPVDVHWPGNPLRRSLANLSKAQGVAIFLDRRIDPDQRIEFDASASTLQTVLDRLAKQIKAEKAVVGAVVYIGPPATADILATLAAMKRKEAALLPAALKAKLLRAEGWRWDELATPRELLTELIAKVGLTIENPERVPHDLWLAVDLPALPAIDRLSILLAGFGLTFEWTDAPSTIRFVDIPAEVRYEQTYTARGDAAKLVNDLQRLFPDAHITRSSASIQVSGRFEDHDKIERLLRGEKVKTTQSKPGEKRYTLTVANQTVGAVIKTIAKDLGKEMEFAPDLIAKLNEKVTFAVKEATLDELLQTTLKAFGLNYRLTETALEIVPANP